MHNSQIAMGFVRGAHIRIADCLRSIWLLECNTLHLYSLCIVRAGILRMVNANCQLPIESHHHQPAAALVLYGNNAHYQHYTLEWE